MFKEIITPATTVIVNEEFVGTVVSVSIRKSSITYEVQKTTPEGPITMWAYDWEITSSHSKTLLREIS